MQLQKTYTNSREEWLKERNLSIGGSDAAGIVGLNKYSSAYSVWTEKTGRTAPAEENEAMRVGTALEPFVAERWSQITGKQVRRRNAVLRNPEYPFAHANVDRWVVGENAGLECKTTSILSLQRFKNGTYPDNYYVQCVHYMAVTGADRWYLAVLVGNKEIKVFTIERDEEEIKALMEQEKAFWGYVERDEAPPVDGSEATNKALGEVYSDAADDTVELFGRQSLITEYYEQQAREKLASNRMEQIKQILKSDLGNSKTGVAGPYTVSWSPSSRSTFNSAAFSKAHPEISLDPYYKTSHSRRFTIKED